MPEPIIIVTAIIPIGAGAGSGGGGGGGGTGGGGRYEIDEPIGETPPGMGQFYAVESEETCSTEDGAAQQIRDNITGTTDVYGPVPFSWTGVEYATAVVRRPGGQWGALNVLIHTQGRVSSSSFPSPGPLDVVAGIVHNHPDALGIPVV